MIDAGQMRRIAAWSRALEEEAFERARAGTRLRDYPAGASVFVVGEYFEPWVGIVDGLAKMRSLNEEGKDVTLAGLHAGGWFGEGTVLKDEVRRYEIVTLRATTLALMDRRTFMWLFENSGAFSQFLVMQLNERLGQFIALLQNDRMLDATGRIARALAWMMNPVLYPDAGGKLDLTQEEIGLLAGVSRQTANQALKCLESVGMIRMEYGGIAILDLPGLLAYENS